MAGTLLKQLGKGIAKVASPMLESGLEQAVKQGTDPNVLKKMSLFDLEEAAGTALTKAGQQAKNTQLDTIVNPSAPEMGVDSLKQQLDTFITTNQQSLESAPLGKMRTEAGEVEAKMFPGSQQELLEKAREYIRLREALHESGEKGFAQSRKGWEQTFGNVVDEEGYPMRLSGGTRTSGGRDLSLKTKKHTIDRKAGLETFSGDFKGEGKSRSWSKLKLEGHHWETAAKEADIFSKLEDGTRRSKGDIEYIDRELKKLNMSLGDKSENLVGLSKVAHMGKEGNPASKLLAAHQTPKARYDFEGFPDWQSQASEIYVQLPPRKGGKNPRHVWYTNKEGKLFSKRGNVEQKLPKGAKKLAFKMPGTQGSFAVGQRHGFSQEFVQALQRTEDPDVIIEAVKTYYQAGIPDLRKGTSAVANTFLQKGPVDAQSAKMFAGAADQEMQVMEDLKKLPEYKNLPEFKEKIAELEAIMRDIAGKNY